MEEFDRPGKLTGKFIVAVGGFASGVGKTTLMCELLRAFPGWEAIKLTRGHYRSCGKDPHACCVSHLLSDEPLVLSGRERTDAVGKDTGRYWEAGAANVHWVVVTDQQVERGVKQALERVESHGVFIEGNSFLKFVAPHFTVMAARAEGGKVKPSARRALPQIQALYLVETGNGARAGFQTWLAGSEHRQLLTNLPVYTPTELPELIAEVKLRFDELRPNRTRSIHENAGSLLG